MNKKWKRFISSVMAMVMICSTFALGNVSSVFADESSESAVDSTTESTPSDVGSIDFSAISDLGGEVTLDVANTLASTVTGGTWEASDSASLNMPDDKTYIELAKIGDYQLYFAKNGAGVKIDTNLGSALYTHIMYGKPKVKVSLNAGDAIKVYYNGGDSSFSDVKAVALNIKGGGVDQTDTNTENTITEVYTLSAVADETGDYEITGSGYYGIYKIEITPAGSSGGDTSTYAGVTITENNADLGTFSLEGEGAYTLNDSFSSCTAADKNFSVGGNYTLTVTLSNNAESYSVDVTGGSYDETTKNIEIKEASVTITINYTKKETTTTTEATTEATTQAVTQSTTEADTETTTQAQTGGFVAVLNAADIAVGDYVNDTCLDTNKYFKVVTSTGSIAVESDSSKTFTPLGGSKIKSVNRISTDGTGSSTKRAIKFKTLTDGKVYVYATSEGSTQRTLTLDNSTTDAIKLPKNGDGVKECIFDVTANKEYVLYANNTAYIYYIGSTAELSPYVTYTATLDTYDNTTYPVVTLDKTEGLTGTETIKATWSKNNTYAAGSKSIDLSTLKPNSDNVFVITPVADWFKLLGEVGNIAVYDADGNLINDSYETITAAVDASTTVAGCTIQVKPGTYVEQIKVDKSITIKKADNTTGDVVIYYDTTQSGSDDGPSGMYPVVWVTADYVTLDGLTITNPYNVGIGDIKANDAIAKRAALAVEGNNGDYNNLTLTSVQDTLFINQRSTNVNTFTDCTIKGCTDWICGGGVNTFNNCNYVFYTGTGATKKDIGYVFAVGYKGKFTVNGGTLSSELPNAEAANYYYARGWQDTVATNDGDYPELYIYGLDNQLPTTFGESGLLGFYGLTGNKKKDSNGKEVYNDEYDGYLLKCNFWAYAGADSNSELIGTTEPNYLVNLISMNDISEYKFESNNNRLLVADYGNGQTTFTRNSIVDAKNYGFVLFENASDATPDNAKVQIEANRFIASNTLFRTVSTETGYANSLDGGLAPGTAAEGKYFGVGVIESTEDLTGETVTVIPYIAFDASYNVGGYDYDTKITYCFGEAKTITFK